MLVFSTQNHFPTKFSPKNHVIHIISGTEWGGLKLNPCCIWFSTFNLSLLQNKIISPNFFSPLLVFDFVATRLHTVAECIVRSKPTAVLLDIAIVWLHVFKQWKYEKCYVISN
jgi:hypothetical protein